MICIKRGVGGRIGGGEKVNFFLLGDDFPIVTECQFVISFLAFVSHFM